MKKNYPVGIQSFEEIRKGNYCYIDKTALIYKLVESCKYYFLSRPDGSGKVCSSPRWKPISRGRRNCSKGLPSKNWRRNGSNIQFCI